MSFAKLITNSPKSTLVTPNTAEGRVRICCRLCGSGYADSDRQHNQLRSAAPSPNSSALSSRAEHERPEDDHAQSRACPELRPRRSPSGYFWSCHLERSEGIRLRIPLRSRKIPCPLVVATGGKRSSFHERRRTKARTENSFSGRCWVPAGMVSPSSNLRFFSPLSFQSLTTIQSPKPPLNPDFAPFVGIWMRHFPPSQ